jgi:hypothetical protein
MNLLRNISKLMAILAVSFAPTLAQEEAVEFDAKITEIKISRRYDSETIVTGVDPRFVVRMILQDDVAGIGKSGDTINFAIHSPARDLRITNTEQAIGKSIRLSLVQASATLKILKRAKTKNAQQAGSGEPATHSESGSVGGDKPHPEAEGRSR